MFKKSGKIKLNRSKLRKKNIEKKINFLLSTIKSKLRTVPINALREKVANAKQIISILIKYIINELRKLDHLTVMVVSGLAATFFYNAPFKSYILISPLIGLFSAYLILKFKK